MANEKKIYRIADKDFANQNTDYSYYIKTDCPAETLRELALISRLDPHDPDFKRLVLDNEKYKRIQDDIKDVLYEAYDDYSDMISDRFLTLIEILGYEYDEIDIAETIEL